MHCLALLGLCLSLCCIPLCLGASAGFGGQDTIVLSERASFNIDLGSILSSTLEATVNAQTRMGATTLRFIDNVGFDTSDDTKQVAMVDFVYEEPSPNNTHVPHRFRFPVLTLLPLPYLQIKDINVKFTARIDSAQATETETGSSFGRGHRVLGSVAAQSSEEKRSYSLTVEMLASQTTIPLGMERMLTLLGDLVNTNAPPPRDDDGP